MQLLPPLEEARSLDQAVEVIAISEREWRVSDPTKVERDGMALLGFVELVDTTYEVTVIGEPRRRLYYASLEESVLALAERSKMVAAAASLPESACA